MLVAFANVPILGTYGVTTSGSALTLKFVTQSAQENVGSRLYLMAPGSTTEYQTFDLINQEFTFDVDVSGLPCGLNGALYFSQMDADGGVVRQKYLHAFLMTLLNTL